MGKKTSRSDEPSRADKKFEKKLQFYAKVRDTVASLSAQKSITKKKKLRSRQKKLKAYDFSTLSEFLSELKDGKQPSNTEFKVNSKNKQKLVLKEGNQLKAVINHPAFQSDPLGSIFNHLESTQPITDEKPKRKQSETGKKKARRKHVNASSAAKSMEF